MPGAAGGVLSYASAARSRATVPVPRAASRLARPAQREVDAVAICQDGPVALRSFSDVPSRIVRLFLQQAGRQYDINRGYPPFGSVKTSLKDRFGGLCAYCGDAPASVAEHLVPINRTSVACTPGATSSRRARRATTPRAAALGKSTRVLTPNGGRSSCATSRSIGTTRTSKSYASSWLVSTSWPTSRCTSDSCVTTPPRGTDETQALVVTEPLVRGPEGLRAGGSVVPRALDRAAGGVPAGIPRARLRGLRHPGATMSPAAWGPWACGECGPAPGRPASPNGRFRWRAAPKSLLVGSSWANLTP